MTDSWKILHAAGDDAEALRQALRLRRGLCVTYVQHFTQEYKPGFSPGQTCFSVISWLHCWGVRAAASSWLVYSPTWRSECVLTADAWWTTDEAAQRTHRHTGWGRGAGCSDRVSSGAAGGNRLNGVFRFKTKASDVGIALLQIGTALHFYMQTD